MGFMIWKPFLLVSMVIMHVWFSGLREHFGEIAGKNKIRPLFLLFGFFCLVVIPLYVFGVLLFGIFGLGGPDTLGHSLLISFLVLRFSMLEVDSL